MKPRLLFLAVICLFLYGWYVISTDQFLRVLNKAMLQKQSRLYSNQASLDKVTPNDSASEHAISITGPTIW